MKITRLPICLALPGAILVAHSRVPAQANSVRELALRQAITEALEHNFDIKIERYEPLIASDQLRLAYGDYDSILSLKPKELDLN